MSEVRLQEIVTRSVLGRGERRVVWSHDAPGEGAESVLGVHVTRYSAEVEQGEGQGRLRLECSCDLWCSFGEETRVQRVTSVCHEPVELPLNAEPLGEVEVTARLVQPPRCVEAQVRDGRLCLSLEARVALEAVGMARLIVRAYPADGEEDLSGGSGVWSDSSGSSSYGFEAGPEGGEEAGEEAAFEPVGEIEEEEEDEGGEEDGGDMSGGFSAHLAAAPVRRRSVPRTSLISHFYQSSGGTRISVIQG